MSSWLQTPAPTTLWKSVCNDSTGQKLVACTSNTTNTTDNGIYTSTDSGGTWHKSNAYDTINWTGVCCDSQCINVIAIGDGIGDGIWKSTDGGSTWNQTLAPTNQPWSYICCDSYCQKIAVATYTYAVGSTVWTSDDSGLTWIQSTTTLHGYIFSLCCDSQGINFYLCSEYLGIWKCTDISELGSTWIQTSAPTSVTIGLAWIPICCDSTGMHIYAGVCGVGGFEVMFENYIWASHDFGSTWIQTSAPLFDWFTICCSSDGSIIYAGARPGNFKNGLVYQSINSGETWTDITTSSSIYSINLAWIYSCCNSSGNKLSGISFFTNATLVTNIYTYNYLPPPPPTPTPTPTPTPNIAPFVVPFVSPNITPFVSPMLVSQPTIQLIPNNDNVTTTMNITFNDNSFISTSNESYVIKNQMGTVISDVYTPNTSTNTFVFKKGTLFQGLNILQIYNTSGTKVSNLFKIDLSTKCFNEQTKILCLVDSLEKYIPIEQLHDCIYVKTYKHGYKKIKKIIKSRLLNVEEKTINKLYRLKKSENNLLIEDLYLTGGHSILKDHLSEKEMKKMKKIVEMNNIKFDYKIDDKYKLLACFDKSISEYNEKGYYNIYQLVLDNDNIVEKNYGIYANGLLVESTNEKINDN
jgi:hypothetical protein